MGKIVKRLFNILKPPLVVVDQVEVDVLITLLHPPRICHKATLVDLHGVLAIHSDTIFLSRREPQGSGRNVIL